MKRRFLYLVIILSCLLTSCDKILLPSETENTPINNFNDLWNNFDKMYGGFEIKNINWDSLYNVYRPMLNENSSDDDLYLVLTKMLDVLNDNHVILLPANSHLINYQSGILGKLKRFSDFKETTVSNHYLIEKKSIGQTIIYGKLSDNVGYVYIGNMDESESYYEKSLEEIFDFLKDTKGMVIDIRNNEGGLDQNSVYIAGHFTTENQVAFKFRLRNGPNHSDFTPFSNYSVKPEGNSQYLKPIVLLTNRFTISAGETFTLAMSRLNHVTIVGDTTSGAFSDAITRELPNGWIYAISVGDWRDSEGKSYEGIGFPPDILIQNDSTNVANGIDEALDKAIDILK